MTMVNIEFNPDLMTIRDVKDITSTMRDLLRAAQETRKQCEEIWINPDIDGKDEEHMFNKLMEDFFWKFVNSTDNLQTR